MVLSFDDARAVVHAALAPTWPADLGTFVVSPEGYEDDQSYLVDAGAQEAMDGDLDFTIMDAPMLLVDKRTGELSELSFLENQDRHDVLLERPVRSTTA